MENNELTPKFLSDMAEDVNEATGNGLFFGFWMEIQKKNGWLIVKHDCSHR
jgi:hypothetical protein